MSHAHFRSVPCQELHLDDYSSSISAQDNDTVDTLVLSATNLLRASREGYSKYLYFLYTLAYLADSAPKRSTLKSSRTLRLLSSILHCTLVAIHLALIAIWKTGLESRLIFPLEDQKVVSFMITVIPTSFGTARPAHFARFIKTHMWQVYCALLVFVTQILSMQRSIQVDQTLTDSHP
jgi:hypothetical protein